PNEKWMFVTDERGGGVVPGGASCVAGSNPYGNGGVHVYKINKGGEFNYALNPDGGHAVSIGAVQVPSPTFCTGHVMQKLKGEQRFVIAWYTQGTKIVDWFLDDNNRWTFRETASVVPQGPAANTWTSNVFKVKRHGNGEVTYYFMSSDITRGIDIFKWRGPSTREAPLLPQPPPADLVAPRGPARVAAPRERWPSVSWGPLSWLLWLDDGELRSKSPGTFPRNTLPLIHIRFRHLPGA
ncbi:MAG TPA: hypothetical protein VEV82_05575, partial [Actinomycetota bacterium]|nr:hypothetical protein [Actinomycetota bacterium]